MNTPLFPLQPNELLVDAYFFNEELTVVNIIVRVYKSAEHLENDDVDGAHLEEHAIQASDNDIFWRQLLDLPGMSIDKIHENTDAYLKQQQHDFEAELEHLAELKGMRLVPIDSIQDDTQFGWFINKVLRTTDDTKEDEKETLFLYKIAIFESEIIKESTNRKLKTELRRAKNILECTKIACELALEVT